jgi:hypothetical protein
LFAKGTV